MADYTVTLHGGPQDGATVGVDEPWPRSQLMMGTDANGDPIIYETRDTSDLDLDYVIYQEGAPVGSTVGSEGPPGEQGPKGDKGDKGDAGLKGGTGAQGPALKLLGPYDNAGVYNPADAVTYTPAGGLPGLYAVLAGKYPNAGTPPTNTTFWAYVGGKGDQGVKGDQGIQGNRGNPGNDGTNGVNGRTIWPVTEPPFTSLGEVGDFAINSGAGLLYGPKKVAAPVWGTGLSLVGPAGANLLLPVDYVPGTAYPERSMVLYQGVVYFVPVGSSAGPAQVPPAAPWKVFVSGGSGSSGPSGKRETLEFTTEGSLAPNAQVKARLALGKGYVLYWFQTSKPCRLRLYASAQQRDADFARPLTEAAVGNHGLQLELRTSPEILIGTFPYGTASNMPQGFNCETPIVDTIPCSITNLGTAGPVTVKLTYMKVEA